jgi:hypothetical protein
VGALPPQYEGWEALGRAARRLSTGELVAEIQDGSPERRLAALSVIDLDAVPPQTVADWIRTLPDVEANQLAGAIPALRRAASCRDLVRWAGIARLGYEQRRLPTFLVMLFSSLEGLEARNCAEAPAIWERVGDWLGATVDRLVAAGDLAAVDDLSLFVFENYLDRDAVFESFCGALGRHRELALRVSTNPIAYLAGLPEAHQLAALQEAERGGGLPLIESWRALHG